MRTPNPGQTYYLKEDPKWIVQIERIETRPKFLDTPVVHIIQPNGRNYFTEEFFLQTFKPVQEITEQKPEP